MDGRDNRLLLLHFLFQKSSLTESRNHKYCLSNYYTATVTVTIINFFLGLFLFLYLR